MKNRVSTKRVYDPALTSDGYRALVMRLWPRGIKKSRITKWFRELAPDYLLLRAYKSARISWAEFSRRYKAGLKKPAAQRQLLELKSILSQRKVTLLCACKDEAHCHRTLLSRKLSKKTSIIQPLSRII